MTINTKEDLEALRQMFALVSYVTCSYKNPNYWPLNKEELINFTRQVCMGGMDIDNIPNYRTLRETLITELQELRGKEAKTKEEKLTDEEFLVKKINSTLMKSEESKLLRLKEISDIINQEIDKEIEKIAN